MTLDPERWNHVTTPVGAVALAAAIAVGGAVGWALAVVGVAVLLVGCVSARDGFLLLGPFPRYELVRLARRQRVHLWRGLIALVVAVPVLVLYGRANGLAGFDPLTRRETAFAATGGFIGVGWHLFLIALTVVMTLLSYAVAEDRESKRLDFILVTDLRGRELVFGKAVARLAGAVLYPLAAAPLVAALPLLFGVDPGLILLAAGYAAAAVLSVGGVALLGSTVSSNRKSSGWVPVAVFGTYLLGTWAATFLDRVPAAWYFPGSISSPPAVSVGDAVLWVNAGNPVRLFYTWLPAGVAGDLSGVERDFRPFAAFHTAAGLLALALAARLVRPAAGRLADGPGPKAAAATAGRKPVGDRPVFWREAYCNAAVAKARQNKRTARLGSGLFVLVPVALLAAAAADALGPMSADVLTLLRFYVPLVGWMVVVAGARLAMEVMPRERERDTLTGVLLTPLPPARLLTESMLGVVWLMRRLFVAELLVGGAAAALGVFPWYALLAALLTQLVLLFEFVGFGAWVGADQPSLEAAGKRFGMLFGGGMGLASVAAAVAFAAMAGAGWTGKFMFPVLFLPVGLLATANPKPPPAGELPLWVGGFLLGMALHAGLAWLLWRAAVRRFVRATDPARAAGPLLTNRDGKS